MDVFGTQAAAATSNGAAGPNAGTSTSEQEELEGQLRTVRETLRGMRDRLVQRTVQRMRGNRAIDLRVRLDPHQLRQLDPQHELPIAKLVAGVLLRTLGVLPADVDVLHDKLLHGPSAELYKQLLASIKSTTCAHIVVRLASAPHNMLEVMQLQINSRPRLFVTNMDRMKLSGFAGIEDPFARQLVTASVTGGQSGFPASAPGAAPGMAGGMQASGGMLQPGGGPPGQAGPGQGQFMPGLVRPPAGVPGQGPPPMPSIMSVPPVASANPSAPGMAMMPPIMPPIMADAAAKRQREGLDGLDLGGLLNKKSVRERVGGDRGEDLASILSKPSARESANLEKFRSAGGPAIQEHCPHLTKEECRRANSCPVCCSRVHFRKIVFPWTDVSLGNCSYLDTCRNMKTCKYVHYELDTMPDVPVPQGQVAQALKKPTVPKYLQALPQPQWINCDVRAFDMSVLGKFGVIMADPPWEIHQDLPYGTMGDDEMRNLNWGVLQDEGVIFLWVTGRAMELGRECLKIWGYNRVDELIWVKTNQLQRLIRTGRTGHWLNHSKEHCLVGVKGNPQLNKYVDCDVVVAEVRETSRKPDEMYSLLERLSPGTRKLEIFARKHNLKPGWVGLGNQLPGVEIMDPEMRARYEARYGKADEHGVLPEPK